MYESILCVCVLFTAPLFLYLILTTCTTQERMYLSSALITYMCVNYIVYRTSITVLGLFLLFFS